MRSVFPPHCVTQAEFTRMVAELGDLGPDQRALLDRPPRDSGVNTRHTVLRRPEYRDMRGFGVAATSDRYIEAAPSSASGRSAPGVSWS
jgi:hypothetical protein